MTDQSGSPHEGQREKEVDEHVAAGRVTVHDDAAAFLAHLDELDSQADDAGTKA